MHRSLLATAALCLLPATSAHALSLTIDPGPDVLPPLGSTITVTVTLDTTGAPAGNIVALKLGWDPSVLVALNATPTFPLGTSSQVITSGLNVGDSNLTSQNGAVAWSGPSLSGCDLSGSGAGSQCITLNQTQINVGPFDPLVPDPAVLVSTLQFEVVGLGTADLHVVQVDAFGATPVFVPEPSTAALVGLGLLGLGAGARRIQHPSP